MVIFEIKTEYIELYKLLKVTGLCSTGAEAKYAITAGTVKVDGAKETRKANKIKAGQKVEYQNMTIEVRGLSEHPSPKNVCR